MSNEKSDLNVSPKNLLPVKLLIFEHIKEILSNKTQNQVGVSALSQVKNTSSFTPDRIDFAHIQGEYFIRDTGLEGSLRLKMASVFRKYLELTLKAFNMTDTQNHLNQLSQLVEKGMDFETRVCGVNNERQFSEAFSQLLEGLKSGEEALLFGGWDN